MSPGRSVMWVLTPEDESAAVGDSVRAVIQWDSEQNSLSAEAVEGRNVLAWVKADYNADEDGFEVSGQDYTGEGDDSDPRAAAAAFRRQVAASLASDRERTSVV